MGGELHNIQQLSDAVQELQAASGKSNEREASFIVSQVQPLNDRVAKLEAALAQIAADLKTLKG
jgi:outer membrane murein-binding lipoprotein Lpp